MTRGLEEYGMMVVAVLVLAVFMAFASVFGGQITGGMTKAANNFSDKANVAISNTNVTNDSGTSTTQANH